MLNDLKIEINEIRESFNQIFNQVAVDLSRWEVEYLPSSLKLIEGLHRLVLANIPKNISNFSEVPEIKITRLQKPKMNIVQLFSQTYLRGKTQQFYNQIRQMATQNTKKIDLKDFEDLKFAKALDLSNLGLAKMPSFRGFDRLTDLNLSNNQLTGIDHSLWSLPNLRILNVANNSIKEISGEIAKLKQLRQLHLEKNKLVDLPPEITKLDNLVYINIMLNDFYQQSGIEYQLNPLYFHNIKGRFHITLDQEVIAWLEKMKNSGCTAIYVN